ncbi:hypothetical protein JCM19992_34870 [Thermostilla marina]
MSAIANAPIDKVLAALETAGCKPRVASKGWQAFCPSHECDGQRHTPSLSIGLGDDGRVLLYCHGNTRCSPERIVAALGLEMTDLMPSHDGSSKAAAGRTARTGSKPKGQTYSSADEALKALRKRHKQESAKWDYWEYYDAEGNPCGLVVRWDKPDGTKEIRPIAKYADGWRIAAMPEPRPLYGLPELLTTDGPVVVVEGEKTAEAARQCGLTAVTSSGGSKAAKKTDWSPLAGRDVIILPDHDDAGERYADDVAESAYKAGAVRVRIVRLAKYAPRLPTRGDLADVLESPDWCGLPLAESVTREDVGRWILATAENEPAVPAPDDPATSDIPAWEPYPTEALPEPFRRFVEETRKAIGCDACYVAMPLLTAAGAAIGTTRCLHPKDNWKVFPILWTALVGESGSQKTPALKAAIQFAQSKERDLAAQNEADRERYEAEQAEYEKAASEWRRSKDGTSQPQKPRPPVSRRALVQDITVEGLAAILRDNPRGVLLACDELAGWLTGFDRYAQTRGKDVTAWLSMHTAYPITVDRKTSGTIYVQSAAVSVTGGIQPAVLQRVLSAGHRENGLLARLLLVMPPRRCKRWTEEDTSPETVSAVAQVFERLCSLEHGYDKDGNPVPLKLKWTPDAKLRYTKFYNQHAEEQNEVEGELAAAFSKLEELPLRLATIFHMVRYAAGEDVDPDIVDADSMQRAIALTEWHKRETKRVYALLLGETADKETRRLIEWIEKQGGEVTSRDLTRNLRRYNKKTAEAEAALQSLVENGFGVWKDTSFDQKRGRPTRVFCLGDKRRRRRNSHKTGDSLIFVGVGSNNNADKTPEPHPVREATPKPTPPTSVNCSDEPESGVIAGNPDPEVVNWLLDEAFLEDDGGADL